MARPETAEYLYQLDPLTYAEYETELLSVSGWFTKAIADELEDNDGYALIVREDENGDKFHIDPMVEGLWRPLVASEGDERIPLDATHIFWVAAAI